LQELLKSLATVGTQNGPSSRSPEVMDLIAFFSEFTGGKSKLGQHMVLKTNYPTLDLELSDITNLRRVLEHVVANAAEASGPGECVEISVGAAPNAGEIKVRDHGAGMTEMFINEELFRPMRTTKTGGFGIGAY